MKFLKKVHFSLSFSPPFSNLFMLLANQHHLPQRSNKSSTAWHIVEEKPGVGSHFLYYQYKDLFHLPPLKKEEGWRKWNQVPKFFSLFFLLSSMRMGLRLTWHLLLLLLKSVQALQSEQRVTAVQKPERRNPQPLTWPTVPPGSGGCRIERCLRTLDGKVSKFL